MKQFHTEGSIFTHGGSPFFSATRFFPKDIQRDTLRLYAFVRLAHDYANARPQNMAGFNKLVRGWHYYRNLPLPQLKPRDSDDVNVRVIKNVCQLAAVYHFDHEWIAAFLDSMRMDIDPPPYQTMEDTLAYIYGSAEVIGLMMAKILGTSVQAYPAAMMQGRAMQYINFIRDIGEDSKAGHCYFSEDELRKYGLKNLTEESALRDPVAFKLFVRAQLALYAQWQSDADGGLHYLPRRARVAVRTAVDGYNWTAQEISRNPFLVFMRQVKPSRRRLILSGVAHFFD